MFDSDLETKRCTLTFNEIMTFTDIKKLIFLRCANTVQVQLNDGPFFNVTALFIATSAFDKVSIKNATTAPIVCYIVQG
jgi:hypothetical protein